MVSTNFVNRSNIALSLPKSSGEATSAKQDHRIEVAVNAKGQAFVNSVAVVDNRKESLQRALTESVRDRRTDSLIISADAGTMHQSIIDVLDAAGQVGLVHVSFATDRTLTPSSGGSR
jgi:biopolymer transport protein ExbD